MFVLKGILLGLGLFGILPCDLRRRHDALAVEGSANAGARDRHWHRLRDDASAQPLDAHCVAGLHHGGAFKLSARGRRASSRSPIVLLSQMTAVDSVWPPIRGWTRIRQAEVIADSS